MSKRPRETESVLDAFRAVCMREPTQEQLANFPAALTPLDKQIFGLRQQLPSTVMLLVVCGYKVKLYGRDSRVASRRFGIMCVKTSPFESSSFPVVRMPHYLSRLTEMGYHVALADQVETAAIRASGTKSGTKVFERRITAIYSRATTSSASFESLYQHSANSSSQGGGGEDDGDDDAQDEGEEPASSSTSEGTLGQTTRRLQEASLRWVLAITVAPDANGANTWHIKLLSFLSLVQSTVDSVNGDSAALVYLRDVLLKCDPCEVICNGASSSSVLAALEQLGECPVHQGPTLEGLEDTCKRTLVAEFQQANMDRLCSEFAERFQSAHVLTKLRVVPLQEIIAGHDVRSMHLPATACNALGLFPSPIRHGSYASSMPSLVELLDRCSTKVGSRMLRRWISAPLCDADTIQLRQDAVRAIAHATKEATPVRTTLDAVVSAVKGYLSDPEATLSRFATGQASVVEVVSLVRVMTKLQNVRPNSAAPSTLPSMFNSLIVEASGDHDVAAMLQYIMERMNIGARGCVDVFEGVPQVPPSIAAIHSAVAQATAALDEALVHIRETLRIPQMQYTTVAGVEFLVDVAVAKVAKGVTIPSDWIVVSRTKSNVRYHPASVVSGTTQLFAARDRLQIAAESEWRALQFTIAELHAGGITAVRGMLRAAGAIDALSSLAQLLAQPGYMMPTLSASASGTIGIIGGRHPLLDVALGGTAVAVDIVIPPHGAWILTGPNMGGKSALLRTAGLFAVMAQIGAPVPAASCCMPVFDAVYCRMGSEDSVLEHRSTFLNEMTETGDILRSPFLHNALVLVDELGQGTSSFDGLAVATATLHHLIHAGATTMFVTHHTVMCDEYRSTTAGEAGPTAAVRCKYMSFEYLTKEGDAPHRHRNPVKFLHVPVDGVSPSSFGIHVASMANLPESVISLAQEQSSIAEAKQRQRIQLHELAAFCGAL